VSISVIVVGSPFLNTIDTASSRPATNHVCIPGVTPHSGSGAQGRDLKPCYQLSGIDPTEIGGTSSGIHVEFTEAS
jgi:hypothetical protein